ncbi:ATP-binding protein [Campylobacterota bacterium]
MDANIRVIKNRFFITTIFILITASAIIAYFQYQTILSEEKNTLLLQHNNIHRNYDLFLKTLQEDLLIDSQILLQQEELREALHRQDRKKLYELSVPVYELLQSSNPFLKIMTFRLHDGTAFLRLHKPQMFGDSLHPSRKIIIETNKNQVAHTGFEVGKLEMVYRAVTPIFYKEHYIGTLEIGVRPDYIIQALKKVGYVQYGLLIKDLDKSAALEKRSLRKIGDYFLVKSDPLFTEELSKIDLNEHQTKLMCCDRLYAIESDLDLFNYKDQPIAKILLGFDIHSISTRTNDLLLNSFVFISTVIILIGALMHIGLNFFMKRLENTQIQLQELNETLEHKVQEEIKKNQVQEQHMLQQSRLAQMGELLSMIAHQWRQPLASINAIITTTKLRYALKDFDLEKKSDQEDLVSYTQKQLDNVEQSIINLSNTIDDFRDFYKPSKQKTITYIHKPIDKALTLIKASFKSNLINYTKEYADTPKIAMHLNEVTQVILNLLQNAMEELLEHKTENAMIYLKTSSDEDNVYIEVCDNGPGIDKKVIPKLFDPYFSTKENKNGSGLGLYMSKMIIEEHHKGKFYLKEENDLTCFVISFKKNQ